ncbi:hypothetical protein ANO11243_009600 [Dothideomycetidae sp. 11243]|nr:hypothetical protein ANO11243_009600 [fungal sp. No.11243]
MVARYGNFVVEDPPSVLTTSAPDKRESIADLTSANMPRFSIHVQWLWPLLVWFLLLQPAYTLPSTTDSSCASVSNVVGMLTSEFTYPKYFCHWYDKSIRHNSPVQGVAPTDLDAACRCVTDGSLPKPSGAGAKSAGQAAAALRQAVTNPVPFCSFWTSVHQRTSSPIPGLGPRQVDAACTAITGTASPSQSHNHKGHATTAKPRKPTKTGNSPSNTSSLPASLQGNSTTASPIIMPAPPHATLTFMPPPGLDLTKLSNLTPAKNQSLYFAGATAGNSSGTTIASTSVEFKSYAVVLDHTVYITSVSCTSSVITIQYNEKAAFLHAETAWKSAADVLLVTSSESCGNSKTSTIFQTTSFSFDSAGMIVTAQGSIKPLKTIVSKTELEFAAVPSNATFMMPKCENIPTNASANFPVAACGSGFDAQLDAELGFYSGDESAFNSVMAEIAPVKSVTSRLRLLARGFLSSVSSFVSHPIQSTANAATSEVEKSVPPSVTNAVSAGEDVASGSGQTGGEHTMGFSYQLPGTSASPWGQQFPIFFWNPTDPGTKKKAQDEHSKAKGTLKSGTDYQVGIQVWCVDCGVKASFDYSGKFAYSEGTGVTAANFQLGASFNASLYLGINFFVEWEATKNWQIYQEGLPGFSIPDLFTVGPSFSINVMAQLQISAQGQVLLGASYAMPDAKASVDFLSAANTYQYGWTPKLYKEFEIYSYLQVQAEFGFPLEFAVGINFLDGSFKEEAALVEQPGLEFDCDLQIVDVTSSGTAASSQCDGFSYSVNVVNDLFLNLFDLSTVPIWHWQSPNLIDGCIPYHPSSTGAIVASTSARPAIASTPHVVIVPTTKPASHPSSKVVGSHSSSSQSTSTASPVPIASIVPPVCNSTYTTPDRRRWITQCGVNYYSNDAKKLVVSNFDECLRACSTFGPACKGVTWVTVGQDKPYCYLKNALAAPTPPPKGLTLFSAIPAPFLDCPAANNTEFQDKNGAVYRVYCDIDMPGNDAHLSDSVTSFEECMEYCDTWSGCDGVVWRFNGTNTAYYNVCYVKQGTSSLVSDKTYPNFKVNTAILLTAPHSKRTASLGERDANGTSSIVIFDVTRRFQLLPGADGNVYLSTNYSSSPEPANFALQNGFVLGDLNNRFFLYYPTLMSSFGASRMRLNPWGSIPHGARLVSWVPYGYNGTTVLTALDTMGNVMFPVACSYQDDWAIKVFLVKDNTVDLSYLAAASLQHVLTGGVVEECNPISLTVEGVPNMVTLNVTASK